MAESDIIVHPRKGKKEKPVPADGRLFVTPGEAERAHKTLLDAGGSRRFLFNSRLTISSCGNYSAAGPAVGAPMAVMTMEKLIALGARSIIMYGWCGAISEEFRVGDVAIGGMAVSGEGTSPYYPVAGQTVPHPGLSADIESQLADIGVECRRGVVWTTDAPYREDRVQLATLRQEDGVEVVDMEYAALCRLAIFRKVAFAGVLLVSDELYHPQWNHGFKDSRFQETNRRLVHLLSGQMLKRS